MQVYLSADPSLGQVPLAGVSALERKRRLIDAMGWRLVAWDQIEPGRELLWIHGWFPSLEENVLSRFVAWGRNQGGALLPAGDPHRGVMFLPKGHTGDRRFVAVRDRLAPPTADGDLGFSLETEADVSRFATESFRRNAANAAATGTVILVPDQTWIEDDVTLGRGTVIWPQAYVGAGSRIGEGVQLHQGVVLRQVEIADRAVIKPYTVIEESRIGAEASVGPFAHIRPGSDLGPGVKVGNFVETKKIEMGAGSKASHLAYLGDATIGKDCNIGAGTITCNYDGFDKHRTVLGDNVFVGSDSQLVAPVRIGQGGYVAAGSTIHTDVPDNALAISRGRQENKENMAIKIRERAAKRKAKKKVP